MAELRTETSIVDLLKSRGQESGRAARAQLAVEHGVVKDTTQYTGSFSQNVSLLQKVKGIAPKTPAAVGDADRDAVGFINAGQDVDIATAKVDEEPPVRGAVDLVKAFKEATGRGLIPEAGLPEAPDFTQSFEALRGQYNVDQLEASINSFDAEEEELQAQLRISTKTEEGKPVALGVIAGRVGEQERNMMERIDFVQRQRTRAVNQLQTANDAIENLMSFKKLDYDVAKDEYDKEFSQNIQLFNTIKGVAQFEATEEEKAEDNARANLQIIYNSIQDGDVDIETIDDKMSTKINKLELMAGLPQGFYTNIQASKPNAKVLSTTTRTSAGVKFADIVYQNTDGSLTTQSVRLGVGEAPTDGQPEISFEEYLKIAQDELQQNIDPAGADYKLLKAQWETDYPAVGTADFTPTELKKLESAGMLGASRKEQISYLYPVEGDDDNPFR